MMLALFSFLAIVLVPTFWVVRLCEVIVRHLLDAFWRKHHYNKYELNDFVFAAFFLFVTIPAYAHLLLLWGGA